MRRSGMEFLMNFSNSVFFKNKKKNIQSLCDNFEDTAENFDEVSTTIEIYI
jgi:hypothetical protein